MNVLNCYFLLEGDGTNLEDRSAAMRRKNTCLKNEFRGIYFLFTSSLKLRQDGQDVHENYVTIL